MSTALAAEPSSEEAEHDNGDDLLEHFDDLDDTIDDNAKKHNDEAKLDEDYVDDEPTTTTSTRANQILPASNNEMDNDTSPPRIENHRRMMDNRLAQGRTTKRATVAVCLLFCVVMFGSAIAVALVVFFSTRRAEQDLFEKQFHSDADKILQSIGDFFDHSLSAMDGFVTMMVGQKDAMPNTSFPFVKIENFALQAAKYKTLTKCFTMGVHYLVQEKDRRDWEAFAEKNSQFVDEAWALQARDETFQGSMEKPPRREDRIFSNFPSYGDRPEGSGPYLVSWGVYPVIYEEFSAPYNYDLFSIPVGEMSLECALLSCGRMAYVVNRPVAVRSFYRNDGYR